MAAFGIYPARSKMSVRGIELSSENELARRERTRLAVGDIWLYIVEVTSPAHSRSRVGSLLLAAGAIALVVIATPNLRYEVPGDWFHSALPIWFLFSLAAVVVGLRLLWHADYGGTDWTPGRPGQRFHEAVMYSRSHCPLCDEAEAVLRDYSRYLPPLTIVDISTDPELTELHGTSIPVVEFDGEVYFRGHVSEVLLRRLIRMTAPE